MPLIKPKSLWDLGYALRAVRTANCRCHPINITTDRVIRTYLTNDSTGDEINRTQYTYDSAGRVKAKHYNFNDLAQTYSYTYAADDLSTKTILPNTGTVAWSYDTLRRVNQQTIKAKSSTITSKTLYTLYTYLPGKGSVSTNSGTTTLLETYTNRLGAYTTGIQSKFTYTYDELGNISSITDLNGNVITYHYDSLSELTRVDDERINKSYTYAIMIRNIDDVDLNLLCVNSDKDHNIIFSKWRIYLRQSLFK